MNRRGFLKRFGIGVSAALVLAQIPSAALDALTVPVAAQRLACAYLLRRYREMARGRTWRDIPVALRVSPGLFTAYEGELMVNERFMPGSAPEGMRSLMFKGLTVTADPALARWEDLQFMERAA